ncbi:hypothetical protein DFJ77DRAFT_356204 [Powellomyces hirtus]|nr:hypothetical protein DFJ77DRAFT_356204 [Powellomyces hirtus]
MTLQSLFPEIRTRLITQIAEHGPRVYPGAEKVALSHSQTHGLHLLATVPIAGNEVILREEPFSFVINQEFETTYCNLCATRAPPATGSSLSLYFCDVCKSLRFAEVSYCRGFQERQGSRGKEQSLHELALQAARHDQATLDLVQSMTRARERVVLLAEVADDDAAEIAQVTGMTPVNVVKVADIIANNSYGLRDGHGRIIGSAFYPILGYADHSCFANATVDDRSGKEIVIRALSKGVQKGEIISLNYLPDASVGVNLTPCARRKMMYDDYGTLCHCDECLRCLNCAVTTQGNHVCGRCHNAPYCSRRCQTAHWEEHRISCRLHAV